TRRAWMLMVGVGLGLLPGCGTHGPLKESTGPPWTEPAALVCASAAPPRASPYHTLNQPDGPPLHPPADVIERVDYSDGGRGRPVAPGPVTATPAGLVEPPPPDSRGTAEASEPQDEEIVRALKCFLHERPAEAVDLLKRYDKTTQELLLRL